jgi:toxin CptA
MHGAPSVSHPVGRSSMGACVVGAVWLAAAAAILAWSRAGASGPRLLIAAALTALLGGLAASWWREPQGTLAWDGERWTWCTSESPLGQQGTLSVIVDLQRLLLVRWTSPGGQHWFWLQPAASRDRWVALRRAVYSRADADAPSGAEPPSSSSTP